MADNQKAEEYLTEVMKQVSGGRYSGEQRSADNIAIPDEKDLHNLEEVESAFASMGDEEFLEMLIRVNEQMEEKNMIPPEFSSKAEKAEEVTISSRIKEKQEALAKEEKEEIPVFEEEVKEKEPEILMSKEDSFSEAEDLLTESGKEELEAGLEELVPAASEWEKGGEEETLGTKLEEDDLELSNIIDFDNDLPEDSLANLAEEDDADLMASLDSIVQEVQGESGFEDSSNEIGQEKEFNGEYDKIAFGEEEGAGEGGEEEVKTKKSKKKKKEKKEDLEKVVKKKSAKKKEPFGQKVKNMFFRVEVVQPLSEEEEEQQKQKKAQEKEEKKKAKAEEKKKKAEERKEAAKQKKEEAAAQKAAKPKKEKEPKLPKEPVSPEEIVHIRPMFLVFLVSVVAALVLSAVALSDTFGYRLAVQEARGEFENGNYEEAFKALNGLNLKDSDTQFYESIRILMRVEKQYRSYVNCSEINMPNESLNSLVKAVENYDKYVDIAETYGIKEELDALLANVEYALKTYGLNLDAVREWNKLEDHNEYTKRIMSYTGSY